MLKLSYISFIMLFIFIYSTLAYADIASDDALLDFQRSLIMSQHRRNTPPPVIPVTPENVATYPLPHADLVPAKVTPTTKLSVKTILDHAVKLPSGSEARSIGVQGGTIILK